MSKIRKELPGEHDSVGSESTAAEPEAFSVERGFVAAVRDGLRQADEGKVLLHDEVGRILDSRFGAIAKEHG